MYAYCKCGAWRILKYFGMCEQCYTEWVARHARPLPLRG
jgi:hypothetical protein